MPDSATLNHAARVLAAIDGTVPADAALRRYLTGAKRLGPREKRAVSRAVFAYFRWLQWLEPKASFQRQLEQAAALQERFNADEKSVKVEALAARAVPDWLADEMEVPPGYLRQLQREPVLWLRARPGTSHKVARELGDCEPAALPHPVPVAAGSTVESPSASPAAVPEALRYVGHDDLFLTPAFHHGAFEIQDLASQLVGHACGARPGEAWWDACAGEGGKLLHLADLMENKGVIWATDRNERRLAVLKRRAARAEVFNYRVAPWDGSARLPTKARFDGILVDAPCSGVGTWQRNPHARWTVTPATVRELAASQLSLLNQVAVALRPHGRLIYSVCTLTRSETTDVVREFSAAHSELAPLPLFGSTPQVTLWPHELNANGMFIAGWHRI